MSIDRLDRLEGFASEFGADFYRYPRNDDYIELTVEEWTVPENLAFGNDNLIPTRGGETITFTVTDGHVTLKRWFRLTENKLPIAYRFRGYLPVVLDLETGGFNASNDAILEIAAVILEMAEDGSMIKGESIFFNVEPFPGANIEQSALDFTGIDPANPLRMAIPEKEALTKTFKAIRSEVNELDVIEPSLSHIMRPSITVLLMQPQNEAT